MMVSESEMIQQLDARIAALTEALRPFAEFARAILHDENKKDEHVIVGKVIRDPAGDWYGRITFGDCRRVAALTPEPAGEGS